MCDKSEVEVQNAFHRFSEEFTDLSRLFFLLYKFSRFRGI